MTLERSPGRRDACFGPTRPSQGERCPSRTCRARPCQTTRRAGRAIMLSFPPFRLDLDNERLWKNSEELRLRRKPFAILRHLVQHPQRLVSHDEIVEAVWGKVATSESLLRTHLSEVRQVLAEG